MVKGVWRDDDGAAPWQTGDVAAALPSEYSNSTDGYHSLPKRINQ